eukprot:1785-Heterococcus_DN1.PRE.6
MHPLGSLDVLSTVMTYVETKQHLWAYKHYCGVNTAVKAAVSDKCKKSHSNSASKSQCLTSINSAVTSAARLEVAAHSGLPFNLRDKQHRSVVADIAGQFGCQEALLWGRQNGLPWSVWLCAGAAKQNRIDMLHWLYIEQGCPLLPSLTAKAAAANGNIAVLQWLWWGRPRQLDDNDAEFDVKAETEHIKAVAEAAAKHGELSTIEWLVQHDMIKLTLLDFLTLCMSGSAHTSARYVRYRLESSILALSCMLMHSDENACYLLQLSPTASTLVIIA